jgi:uncharacterized membrane protein
MAPATGPDQLDPLRHQRDHQHLHGAFGTDTFGRRAEMLARLFGTPQYIVGQSVVVEELSARQLQLLQENTDLTQRVAELSEKIEQLTEAIHSRVVDSGR